jgi:CitMHS family citrate-Mg2+:H+ or citrate-Ca2+:H+ symporter
MYQETIITLLVMIIAYALSLWKLKSAEISMVIAAIAGAIAAGFGFPARILVEGTFTYIDLGLIFVTASIFINIYAETGAINAMVASV